MHIDCKNEKNNFVLLWSIATSFLENNLFWETVDGKRGEKENKFIKDRVFFLIMKKTTFLPLETKEDFFELI